MEFTKGKWYKVDGGFYKYFGKFLEQSSSLSFVSSERIMENKHRTNRYTFCGGYKWVEIPISEIQQYLPDGYKDKKPIEVVRMDNSALVVGNIYYGKGNDYKCIFKFHSMHNGSVRGTDRVNIRDHQYSDDVCSLSKFKDELRPATPQEKQWLKMCRNAGRFIYKEDIKTSKKKANDFECTNDNRYGLNEFREGCTQECDKCEYYTHNKNSINKKSKNNDKSKRSIKICRQSSKVSRGKRPRGNSVRLGRSSRTVKGRYQGNVPNLQTA